MRTLRFVLVAFLFTPLISQAAWWNPVSWFPKPPVEPEVITETVTVEVPVEKIVERVVIKEVVKTIDKQETLDNLAETREAFLKATEEIKERDVEIQTLEDERDAIQKRLDTRTKQFWEIVRIANEQLQMIDSCRASLGSYSSYTPASVSTEDIPCPPGYIKGRYGPGTCGK